MTDRITVQSPAKINWNLRIVCRRPDGFHELESLVTPVSLCDDLTFTPTADGSIKLLCDHPDVPTDNRNLVYKAVELIRERAGIKQGVTCDMRKRIPIGGGVGGGSSNAATTMLALKQLWALDWSTDQLLEAAAELGSDVALFVRGGSAVMTGRGEHVKPVELPWTGWIVLILPPLSVSTAAVYKAWQPGAPMFEDRPIEGTPAESAADWMDQAFNMLEPPAFAVCPELERLFNRASEIADRPVRMSGSGSTLFTAFDALAEAEAFAAEVETQMQVTTKIVQPVKKQQ